MICWNCNYNRNSDFQFCRKCLANLHDPQVKVEKRRRGLTEHEALKLSWYRDESKWIDNIRNRTMATDKNGNKIAVSQGKILPRQPSQYYKNGGKVIK